MLSGSITFLLVTGAAPTDPPKGAERPMPVLTLPAHGQVATCVHFSPDGMRLASAGLDNWINVWDVVAGKKLLTLADCIGTALCTVSFSPDGRRLAAWDRSPAVRVWDTETGKSLLALPAAQPVFA